MISHVLPSSGQNLCSFLSRWVVGGCQLVVLDSLHFQICIELFESELCTVVRYDDDRSKGLTTGILKVVVYDIWLQLAKM